MSWFYCDFRQSTQLISIHSTIVTSDNFDTIKYTPLSILYRKNWQENTYIELQMYICFIRLFSRFIIRNKNVHVDWGLKPSCSCQWLNHFLLNHHCAFDRMWVLLAANEFIITTVTVWLCVNKITFISCSFNCYTQNV